MVLPCPCMFWSLGTSTITDAACLAFLLCGSKPTVSVVVKHREVCLRVWVCVMEGEWECGCVQMVHKPTFQLGPEYKYPWLIGMWRLLAQKASAWPGSRTLSLTHSPGRGWKPPKVTLSMDAMISNSLCLPRPLSLLFSIPVAIRPAPSPASSVIMGDELPDNLSLRPESLSPGPVGLTIPVSISILLIHLPPPDRYPIPSPRTPPPCPFVSVLGGAMEDPAMCPLILSKTRKRNASSNALTKNGGAMPVSGIRQREIEQEGRASGIPSPGKALRQCCRSASSPSIHTGVS
ncbi:unnamed protein product [Pleuronectes platessa]|uniref:Uncharacterized protein n=1 Tax=Pleuronectes platessa TaxID=8262 RepID=A0A9N7UEL3_PLEPL|nr:unnamed protein product [Pleuronectes platessa]